MKRAAVGLLVAAAFLAIAIPAGATSAGAQRRQVDRVLIVSLPHVSWDDLDQVELPNLERFFEHAGLADLAPRSTPVGLSGRETFLGDAYVALGAGTRSVGDGGKTDGEGLGVHEPFSPETAGEVFERRTGRTPHGELVQLAIAQIVAQNDALPLDAEPGALGDALAAAGFSRAVIANGDGIEPQGDPPVYRRAAVSALMSSTGVVPQGRVAPELLEAQPSAPFGLRYDNRKVVAAFDDVWRPRSVVLVEASDLVRMDAYRRYATSDQRDVLRAHALHRTDELFGDLVDKVDFEHDAVIVVGPAHETGTTTLTVAAMRAPGVEPGLLRSATTRRSGFVQLVDVAPTVLELVGVERPASMAGRPFESGSRGGSTTAARIDGLVNADEAAQFIGDQVEPVAIAFVVGHALVALAMALWLTGRAPPFITTGRLQYAALALLGAIPAIYLARLVPLHDLGVAVYWLYVVGVALVLGGLYALAGRRRWFDALIVANGVTVGLLVLDVVSGSRLQINSALGNSPIVAGRFTGFGNLAFAVLSSSSLVLAVLLAIRIGGRRGTWVAAACLGGTIIAAGAPFWGSDVGGVLSMSPAFLVTIVLMLGWRFRIRTVILAAVATLVVITGFALLDLAREPDQRTHLGRLFETIGDEGWSGFSTVVERKLSANVASLTGTVWIVAVFVGIAFLAFLAWRALDELRSLAARFPQLRAAAIGAAVLLVVGLALNDSGIRVPALMLTVFDAALVILILRDPDRVVRDQPALAQTYAST